MRSRALARTSCLAVLLASLLPSGARAGGGTFGQSVPAFAEAERARPGTARTILVLANPTEVPGDGDVLLAGESGDPLGSGRSSLAPLGMTQVTRVARAPGVTADVAGARLVLSTATP